MMSLDAISTAIDSVPPERGAVRAEFLTGIECCRASVLHPKHDLGLHADLRAALALRIRQKSAPKVANFADRNGTDLQRISGGGMPEDMKLAAIAIFVDLVTVEPGRAEGADLAALRKAGLTEPQIVALCELAGFACFDLRVSFGLSLLKDVP